MQQNPVISQLHRSIGQLQGIEKMIKNKTEISKTVQQIEAVKGNINSIEKKILISHTKISKNNELKSIISYLTKL